MVDAWSPARESVEPVRDAVQMSGPLNHLRVHPTAVTEFWVALTSFLGGSIDNADAVLTDVPAEEEQRVFWLRGNAFGSLALKAHTGPEGANEPAVVSGYVRSLDDVLRVEVLGVKAVWPLSGGFPTIHPDVNVHFQDEVVEIRVSERSRAATQAQAGDFVRKLFDALAHRT
jgi:hypothetical protein